ncbi:hypothetical protein NEFER03_1894 [Nematocida sp. LUAm3]|nr:hypothetical protein NEFER03_1894 [Nematocida sp. LUAm3]KAI5173955.1 hypothetical protein NEFER02_0422 [Nematocida sp. LUAm2]KAI5177300.1 hypothetical protein NEFER01_0575 [Nematocida sp. LUAm1]
MGANPNQPNPMSASRAGSVPEQSALNGQPGALPNQMAPPAGQPGALPSAANPMAPTASTDVSGQGALNGQSDAANPSNLPDCQNCVPGQPCKCKGQTADGKPATCICKDGKCVDPQGKPCKCSSQVPCKCDKSKGQKCIACDPQSSKNAGLL